MEKAIQIARRKNGNFIGLIMTITNLHFADLNDYENALKYYDSWIDMFGGPEDFVNRAWCYYYLKDKKRAIVDFRRATQSGNHEAEFQFAQFHKLEHRYDSSMFYLNRILAEENGNAKLLQISRIEKAKLLIASNKESEAKAILQEIDANAGRYHYEVLFNARTLLASMSPR